MKTEIHLALSERCDGDDEETNGETTSARLA
jgi:hypothetical protein